MKMKYYVRGLGIGFVISSLIFIMAFSFYKPGYSKDEIKKQFQDNTILISTSIIETLGLHVIESIQQGVLVIVPNEKYSLDVYGNDILTYNLFNIESLYNIIQNIYLQDNNYIKDIILRNQKYLIDNEKTKYKNIENIFNKILKENNV